MFNYKDRSRRSGSSKRVETVLDENSILDKPSTVEVKNNSVRNILLGILFGVIAGLVVVGIIAAALIFAYGTAGVGPLVLGLFGGISAIAAWSSVAAIGAGIVGLFATIGGFIGNAISSSQESGEVKETLLAKDSNNAMHDGLGPINTSEDSLTQIKNKIVTINKDFKGQIQYNYANTIDESRIKALFSAVDLITTFDSVDKIIKQIDLLEGKVNLFKGDEAYKQDILTYVALVRTTVKSSEVNEVIKLDEVEVPTIESINKAFLEKMTQKQKNGEFSIERLKGLNRAAAVIENTETTVTQKQALLDNLLKSVCYISDESAKTEVQYRDDIEHYVNEIRFAMNSPEVNESDEEEVLQSNNNNII